MLLKLSGLSFLLTTDCVGGVLTQTLALARDLTARGAKVIIATIGPQARPDQINDLIETGAEWIVIKGDLDWMAKDPDDIAQTAKEIEKLARARRVTSVHLHAPAYAAFGFEWPHIVACHSCHATWWAAVHNGETLPADLAWRANLTGAGLALAPDAIAPSDSFAAALVEQYHLLHRPVAIPNGIPIGPEIPRQHRSSVVAVGRFWDEAKNFATLQRISKIVAHPLTAVGPTPDTFQNVPGSRLQATGSLPAHQVREILSQSAIFVSAALYEPFGLAALEAAQAGAALLLSDIPAHRENWDGVAIFHEPHDFESFSRSINQLLANPDEAEERGLSARHRARLFTPEKMGEAIALTHLHPRKGRIAA